MPALSLSPLRLPHLSHLFHLSRFHVLVLPLLLTACNQAATPTAMSGAAMPPPEVNIVKLKQKDLALSFEYAGQTAGSSETEVRARVGGILEKRLFEEGSRVKAGTPLFQLDADNFKTQLASAQAELAVSRARAAQAQRELARITPLLAEKAISQKEYDDAKSAHEIAQAGLQQLQARVEEARLNLRYTTVQAPIDGVTGVALKANGSLVSGADSLLTTLVQTDPLYVNFNIPEADYLKLMRDVASKTLVLPGKRAANGSLPFTVKLKLADGSIYPVSGQMNFANEKVNSDTASIAARAQIPNPQGVLRPGQFVRVMLQGASRSSALAVPQRAVVDGPMGKMVFVVGADNKLAPRPVELDGWSQGDWIVTGGLRDGEQVLVDGFIKAHTPGMTVKPVLLSDKPGDKAPPAKPAGSQGAASAAGH